MTYDFQWSVVFDNLPYLLEGVSMTVQVTLCSLLISLIAGLVLGLMRMSKNRLWSILAKCYIEVFRNTPALVQLIWVYYCLPVLTGINLSPVVSCTIALAVNGAAYCAEIFRTGIQGVEKGQMEAARSIGMGYGKAMRKIILPQAVRAMAPAFVNEFVSLLKYSSLVSVLGVADLTYQAQTLSTTTFRPIEIFTFIGIVYFLLCWCISLAASRLDRRLKG